MHLPSDLIPYHLSSYHLSSYSGHSSYTSSFAALQTCQALFPMGLAHAVSSAWDNHTPDAFTTHSLISCRSSFKGHLLNGTSLKTNLKLQPLPTPNPLYCFIFHQSIYPFLTHYTLYIYIYTYSFIIYKYILFYMIYF